MSVWNSGVRRSSLGFDTRTLAERNVAIESLRNFASFDLGAKSESKPEPDVDAVVAEVSKASNPVSIVDLANTLGWDADKLATALARGGELRRLAFSKAGDRTFVALPAAPSGAAR